MIVRLNLTLTLILLAATPRASAEPFDGFDKYMDAVRKEWRVPGLAIAIVKDGQVVLARGYGVTRSVDGQQVDADTVFPLASITKNFTATALAQLVEQGKLNWDDPVIKHVPELKFVDPYRTKHVTIRDLLCHRTGLERGDLLPRRGDVSISQIVDRVRYLQPSSELRTKWQYNNLMYYVAGEVTAEAAASEWEDVVADQLLKPLAMAATFTAGNKSHRSNRSHPHRIVDDNVLPARILDWQGNASPAGSMHSSAHDMAKWLLATLDDHQGKRRLLKRSTRREMESIQMSIPVTWDRGNNPYAAKFCGWGLGWTVVDYQGRKVCYHAGSSGSMLAVIPEERLGVVILSNLEWTNLAGMLMYDVFDAYLSDFERAWHRDRWDFWKKADPHPEVQRRNDLAAAQAKRQAHIAATLPLASYTGKYTCDLYGDIDVRQQNGQLFFPIWEQRREGAQ